MFLIVPQSFKLSSLQSLKPKGFQTNTHCQQRLLKRKCSFRIVAGHYDRACQFSTAVILTGNSLSFFTIIASFVIIYRKHFIWILITSA